MCTSVQIIYFLPAINRFIDPYKLQKGQLKVIQSIRTSEETNAVHVFMGYIRRDRQITEGEGFGRMEVRG